MARNSRSPAWPFLSILACLFVLSITAPRAWQRIAHAPLAKATHLRQQIGDGPAASRGDLAASSSPESPEVPSPTSLPEGEQMPVAEQMPIVEQSPIAAPLPAVVASAPPVQPVEMPAAIAAPTPIAIAPAFGNRVGEDPLQVAARSLPEKLDADEVLVPPPPPQSTVPNAAIGSDQNWSMPFRLLAQLAALSKFPTCRAWADDVCRQLQTLSETNLQGGTDSRTAAARARSLDALTALVGTGQQLTGKIEDQSQQTQFLRTHYALERRLAIWRQIIQPAEAAESEAGAAPIGTSAERVSAKVKELQTLMASSEAGNGWREYLQLDRLHEVARSEHLDVAERRQLARQILDRLARARDSRQQRHFVADGPLATLGMELQSWSAEPVSPQRLLARLETYERTGLSSDAQLLATDCRWLRWSDQSADRQLASEVDGFYRNANLRVAVAGGLVNRFVPQPAAINAPISDTLIGVPVRGRSTTWTELHLRLIPDARRVRLGLEATGVVASDTASSSGPATFYNNGTSTFLVRKLYVLGPKGLRDWPAIGEACSGSKLVSMETEFDGIPLFGPLVRSIARSQFEDSQPEALGEAQQKLANRARSQFDGTVNQRMQEAQASFEQRFLRRFEKLGVDLAPVSFITTDERIVARMRVANDEQLGAHTPRPRAPSDSQVSVQLHQSAFNNMLDGLDLAGRKFALADLFQWINKKLDRPQTALPDDLPDDVFITFAAKDPVSVRLMNDRAELCLTMSELSQGRNRWRNFTVRASYRPEVHELQAGFQRDNGIRLEGESIKGKPELLLRGIFSRVLSSNRQVQLIAEQFSKDPRVKDLAITQFVVDDGWLGLACGPKRKDASVQRSTDLQANRDTDLSHTH